MKLASWMRIVLTHNYNELGLGAIIEIYTWFLALGGQGTNLNALINCDLHFAGKLCIMQIVGGLPKIAPIKFDW